MRTWLFVVLGLLWADASAAAADEAIEPPIAGRPANFSGAVGDYRISTRASPTVLQAEDSLQFTVRIIGTAPLKGVARPDLRRLPRFAKHFHIENAGDRDLPQEKAREFDYRLRPRDAEIKEVPALPFVFFKPGFLPAHLGYQTRYAPAIPITVKPRAEVPATAIQGEGEPLHALADFYGVVTGEPVLRYQEPFALPAVVLVAVLLLPPCLGVGWYGWWRRRHPTEARLLWERRRGAARQALHALRDLRGASGDAAGEAGRIVAEYLRQRLHLTMNDPTPAELADRLGRMAVSSEAAEAFGAFLRACAIAQFAPGLVSSDRDWPVEAGDLIRKLEAEPWASSSACS